MEQEPDIIDMMEVKELRVELRKVLIENAALKKLTSDNSDYSEVPDCFLRDQCMNNNAECVTCPERDNV